MRERSVLVMVLTVLGCGRDGLGNRVLLPEAGTDQGGAGDDAPSSTFRESTGPFVRVECGGTDETCGLKADGAMVCWGRFGDFPPSAEYGPSYVPRPLVDGWKDVSPASPFTCGITRADALLCWGLPFERSGESLHPPDGTYHDVDARGPCAIRLADGGVTCWGPALDWGATMPDGNFTMLRIGDAACGLRNDGEVACWGNQRIVEALGPTPRGPFKEIAQGGLFSCALRPDGELVCWGVAVPAWSGADARQAPAPDGKFAQIAAGANAACGVRMDGSLACWGMVWGAVPPPGQYLQVSVGSSGAPVPVYFCALRVDGIVVCWGGNSSGESSPP